MMKNIMITGVAGELGMLLCNTFLNEGIDIFGIDHADRDGHEGLDLIGRNAMFHFFNQSLHEVDWKEFEKADVIFHLAQTCPETNRISELKKIMQQQQYNMKEVVRYASERGGKVILVSTTDVNGKSGESENPRPSNLYAALMLAEESFLSEIGDALEVDYHILRVPQVAGCRNNIEERCNTIDKTEKAGVSDQGREFSSTFTITKQKFIMSCNQLINGEQPEKIVTLYGKG